MGVWLAAMLYAYAVPLLVYFAFAVPALFYLRDRDLDDTSRAVWSLAIVGVPIMGAVAFAAMKPGLRRR